MEKELARILLPEGTLDYFEVTSVSQTEEDFTISLVEQDHHPPEFSGNDLVSKGFSEQVTIKDFPIRGKACFLKVKRRRWLNKTTEKIVTRDWELVAKGTRMTTSFASFLKAVHRYESSKL